MGSPLMLWVPATDNAFPIPFPYGSSKVLECCTDHAWAEGGQLVIQQSRLADVARLEGDLQTAAAHAEAHAVLVDMVRLG